MVDLSAAWLADLKDKQMVLLWVDSMDFLLVEQMAHCWDGPQADEMVDHWVETTADVSVGMLVGAWVAEWAVTMVDVLVDWMVALTDNLKVIEMDMRMVGLLETVWVVSLEATMERWEKLERM